MPKNCLFGHFIIWFMSSRKENVTLSKFWKPINGDPSLYKSVEGRLKTVMQSIFEQLIEFTSMSFRFLSPFICSIV